MKTLEFRGSGREFFGIWIVNLLLSIVTLGIYIPWARVRTRRYFHRSTLLDGHEFDYVADPKRLLVGYLIVGAFFIVYMVSNVINPLIAIGALAVFWIVFPWLRYKSLRFYAANSTYRGVRFRFEGTARGSYAAFMGWPLLGAVSIGLLWPFAIFKEKGYYFGNFAFGNYRSEFRGEAGWFYKNLILLAVFVVIWMVVFFGIVIGLTMAVASPGEADAASRMPEWLPMVFVGFFYVPMFVLFGVWRVLSLNYCWNHAAMNPGAEEVSFRSGMKSGRYLWIFFSNIVLIVLTLGLFAPFAAVRSYRYRIECLSVAGAESLDRAVTVASAEQNAMGESAADLFDFEFGL